MVISTSLLHIFVWARLWWALDISIVVQERLYYWKWKQSSSKLSSSWQDTSTLYCDHPLSEHTILMLCDLMGKVKEKKVEEKQTSLLFLMKISYFASFFFCWLFLCKLISHQGFWCGLLSTITYPWGRNSLSHSFLSFCFSSWQADVMYPVWVRSDIWTGWLYLDGKRRRRNCPILPLHVQDLAKSYPQSHIRAHDDGYLVFLESWGENPISHGFAHYSWAYTKK